MNAEEFALTVTDLDADGFVHWIVYRLKAGERGLAEGELPPGGAEGATDFDETGYGGPCPPEGDEPHRYEFTLYALERAATSDLGEGASLDDLLDAIECCVTAKGSLTGTYGR